MFLLMKERKRRQEGDRGTHGERDTGKSVSHLDMDTTGKMNEFTVFSSVTRYQPGSWCSVNVSHLKKRRYLTVQLKFRAPEK